MPNWNCLICAPPARLNTLPAVAGLQSTQLSGRPRFTLLKMLKPSARNSTLVASVILNFLKTDRSVWKNDGPRRLLRPTFPNCPSGALAHGAPGPIPAENQPSRLLALRFGSPTRSGLQGPELTEQFVPNDTVGVNGRPLIQVVLELSCQPPKRRSTALCEFPKNRLPRPTGNSHTSEDEHVLAVLIGWAAAE